MLLDLPDSLILQIFKFLTPKDAAKAGQCCAALRRVALDELLWRDYFHRYFRVSPFFKEPIGSDSWRSEFIRLVDETPVVEAEVLTKHTDQVLHVSFAHNGSRFATTAKDAYVHVWKSTHPVELEFSYSMKRFSWKYTQFSQFNESDTLLLVSGVLFGLQSTSGEIVIFSLNDGFQIACRIPNKPYDIFGAWYSDEFLFSGDLQWLGNLVSKSVIWLNKASQELESEHAAVMNLLYKFYNPKASSIRSLIVANCVDTPNSSGKSSPELPTTSGCSTSRNVLSSSTKGKYDRVGNPPSHFNLPQERDLMRINSRGVRGTLQGAFQNWKPIDNVSDIGYTAEFHNKVSRDLERDRQGHGGDDENPGSSKAAARPRTTSVPEHDGCTSDGRAQKRLKYLSDKSSPTSENVSKPNPDDPEVGSSGSSGCTSVTAVANSPVNDALLSPPRKQTLDNDSLSDSDEDEESEVSFKPCRLAESSSKDTDQDEIIDPREKWLIFTCGSETYTPHQVGFKRIKPFKFKGKIETGLSLRERLDERRRRKLLEENNEVEEIDYSDFDNVADRFDTIDHKIDLHGHIIGLTLSPDHRYLYVNSRPWPAGYTISDPLAPPPIAQEIDIHVIDLITLRQVGMMRRAHRAYTPNEECFFIFLDASEYYLASGAEDKFGYLWDRHYGISLTKLPHSDVVNAVAFNPIESEMLVTVSDDQTIKVWRSKRQCRELGIDQSGKTLGTKLYLKPRPFPGPSNSI